eukprot:2967769-Pleurochrysis_carterae.AAC.1
MKINNDILFKRGGVIVSFINQKSRVLNALLRTQKLETEENAAVQRGIVEAKTKEKELWKEGGMKKLKRDQANNAVA